MQLKIKEISAEDTYDLRSRVMWPNKPKTYVTLTNDADGIHFGLFNNSKLISVVSLFIKNDRAQFRKFATALSQQGNGYGTLLLNHVVSYASGLNINTIWCNARADKALFYEKFGMHQTAYTFLKEDITYIIMEKNLL